MAKTELSVDPTTDYADNRIVLTEFGEFAGSSVEAFCSPDASNRVFGPDGQRCRSVECDLSSIEWEAPFEIDVVYLKEVPDDSIHADVLGELQSVFASQFEERVDDVYKEIMDADDPIDVIMDLDPQAAGK